VVQARLVNTNPSEPYFPPFTVNYDVFPHADLRLPGIYQGLYGSVLTISAGNDPATFRANADPVSVSPEPSTMGLLLIPGALLLKLVQKRNRL
jgi:hypothetical protein